MPRGRSFNKLRDNFAAPTLVKPALVAMFLTPQLTGYTAMFDPQRLLGQLLSGGIGGGLGHRKRGGGGLSFGTKAQLGLGALGIAMAAYEHFTKPSAAPASAAPVAPPLAPLMQSGPSVATGMPMAPPPPPPAINLAQLPPAQVDAVLLVQSMIAAAAADGVIDTSERARLLQHAADGGLDAQTRHFLEAELAVPKSAEMIGAMTRPDLVDDVYAAAACAIDVDSESERRFLATLGNALGLDADARSAIHQRMDAKQG